MTGTVARNVLARAAARIERDGWHQGGYYTGWSTNLDVVEWGWRGVNEALNREPRPCCAIGAVMAEARSAPDYHEAERALMHSAGIDHSTGLADFNDAPGRTSDEVVDLLYAAAEGGAR